MQRRSDRLLHPAHKDKKEIKKDTETEVFDMLTKQKRAKHNYIVMSVTKKCFLRSITVHTRRKEVLSYMKKYLTNQIAITNNLTSSQLLRDHFPELNRQD